jgi:hypothetical protein
MRRSRLLILATTALLTLALGAAASAKVAIGVAENEPRLFSDPLFQQLGVKRARIVVSYNVMTSGDDEINRVIDYLRGARASGVEPLVTFEHARGDASRCKRAANRNKKPCKLPTRKTYERNLRLFLQAFPDVKTIAPWNEANHFTQPTWRSAKRAAQFSNTARRLCPGCTIVVADLLDQADDPKASHPTYSATVRYARKLRRNLKGKRGICGIHNYSDTNRFRSTGTRAVIRALKCKRIWLTETGGIYKFGSFHASQKRQLRATKYMFKLARRIKKVKRLYVYTWFGGVTSRFDAGLVAHGKARKAYAEVKKHVG